MKTLRLIVSLVCIAIFCALTPLILVGLACGALAYVALRWIWRRWNALADWYERMYCDQVWRERHEVEERARALGALRLPEWPA